MLESSRLYALARHSLIWRVLTNATWVSAATPISVGLSLIQTGMLARMLGPEGIGAIALFNAVAASFGGLLKLTSAEALMVYTSKALAERNHAEANRLINYFYRLDFLSSLIAYLACVASAFFLPHWLNLPAGQEWLQAIFGLNLIFQSTYWVSQSVLRVTNHFSWTFYQVIVHSVVKTILIAWLFLERSGLTEVVFLLAGLSLFDGLSLYIMSHWAWRQRVTRSLQSSEPWWRVSGEVWRFQMLGYGRQLIKSLNRYSDMLLIGYFGTPLQVGYYRAGKQVSELINLPGQAFVASLFPEYSRLYFSGDVSRLRSLVFRFSIFFAGLGLVGLFIAWIAAEWAIRIILGDAFLSALEAVRILMVAAVINLAMSPVYSLPAAVGRAKPALWSASIALLVQIAMIIWLVPQSGALGAAWASLAYNVVWAFVLLPHILTVLKGH